MSTAADRIAAVDKAAIDLPSVFAFGMLDGLLMRLESAVRFGPVLTPEAVAEMAECSLLIATGHARKKIAEALLLETAGAGADGSAS